MKGTRACLAAVLVAAGVLAETKPFNLSLAPTVAIHDRTTMIEGVTLSIWGENEQKSLALGIVNGCLGDSSGLSIGILNYADNYYGLQWGLVNYTTGDCLGWQGGFLIGLVGSVVNYTGRSMEGFQAGLVNYAGRLKGLQLGVFNYAEGMGAGLQIGVLNIIRDNTVWFSNLPDELAPGMVLVNWRF